MVEGVDEGICAPEVGILQSKGPFRYGKNRGLTGGQSPLYSRMKWNRVRP